MSATGKATVGQVFRGVAGLATLATLLATIIVVLLGAFRVVDMEGVVTANDGAGLRRRAWKLSR